MLVCCSATKVSFQIELNAGLRSCFDLLPEKIGVFSQGYFLKVEMMHQIKVKASNYITITMPWSNHKPTSSRKKVKFCFDISNQVQR